MVSRLDLDGTHSPLGLVTKIIQAEPNLPIPVPVHELAFQLDISEIRELETAGFLGGLLTNEERSFGAILVAEGLSHHRTRFTVAHELGHFLNPYHKPANEGQFLCDSAAFSQLDVRTKHRAHKMEAEANRFAAYLLMPPPVLRQTIDSKRYASLKTVVEIHEIFDVSKESAARAYVEYCAETVAIIIAKNGKLLRYYPGRTFPKLALGKGNRIPEVSLCHSNGFKGQLTESDPTDVHHWIDGDWISPVRGLYEQVLFLSNGYSFIHLKAVMADPDEFDPEERMTSAERLRSRLR
jgi:Zn-dependent peptidase ImmA (M78 family)